jgi:glycosyltransferase involved in cell wall biosynthesis
MTHAAPPTIEPLPDSPDRPFWSVMIPTYNCADLVRETLQSVLDEQVSPQDMQIEVIDDCSTKDDPEAVVRELGQGRVDFYRQPENCGAIETFNTCIRRSRGRVVHILHGDDAIRPGYYQAMKKGFDEHPEAGAAACRAIIFDEYSDWTSIGRLFARDAGILEDFFFSQAARQKIYFPTISVRRGVYEAVGGFRPDLPHCADWEMWARILSRYPFYYDPAPLALYRIHSRSDTSRLALTGADIDDENKAVSYIQTYIIDPARRKTALQEFRRGSAKRALNTAAELRKEHFKSSLIQIRKGLSQYPSLRNMYKALRIITG